MNPEIRATHEPSPRRRPLDGRRLRRDRPDTGHEDTSEDAGMRQPKTPFDGLRNDAPTAAVRGWLADARETAASSGEGGR